MTDATSKLISDLDTRIVSAKTELAEARQAASLATELEAELSRLEAARKALAAPQSPDGRKRIGQARRKKMEPISEAAQLAPNGMQCSQCHKPGNLASLLICPADDCEGSLHLGPCYDTHYRRFHLEGA